MDRCYFPYAGSLMTVPEISYVHATKRHGDYLSQISDLWWPHVSNGYSRYTGMITAPTKKSYNTPARSLSPHQVGQINFVTCPTAHLEICGKVLFAKVTAVKKRDGPRRLRGSDDDGDDDDA